MKDRTPSAISDGEKYVFVPNLGQHALARPIRPTVRRVWMAFLAAVLLAATLVAVPAAPLKAAIDLEYFNAVASGSAVLLEWSTASEFNVAGFEILKKKVGDPESAFSRVGFYNAKGDTTSTAQYDTLVTNLTAGVAYCFRLREVTSDDEPGEVRDLCGFGLSITPTPASSVPAAAAAAATSGAVLFPTPTPDPLVATPTQDPLAAQQFPAPDPFQSQSPLPTPTVDPFASPTPTVDPFTQASSVPVDPFAQPTPTIDPFAPPPTATVDPFAPPTSTIDPFAQPTVDPVVQNAQIDPATGWQIDPVTGYPVNPATGLPTDPAQALLIAQQPQSPLPEPTTAPALVPTATPHTSGFDITSAEPTPSPTSIYIVVTAAPAGMDADQGLAVVVTPWPTVAAAPAPVLGALFTPNAQNLTVLMLCFIFLSATALGGLGLMTVVLYLRARNQREEDRARLRGRR